ncbi:hypothetical protein [Dryocola boscaweniae]|uniref:Uncharacterized protein n=2 Tax=Dryocola boscaweniae TaxID=2925397 RepID=A0A9X3AN72_9ENTR|nr:hypothetical protein [Dryocola boscaweniae]MCT4701571.1 hypothetical protein [Dryocola boscaweniae]
MMEDLIFNRGNKLPIHYRFKKSAGDGDHLLIVMSGFNIPDPTIYDCSNVLTHCDSHILWIKDDFNGLPAYYLCNNMSFDIESGVSLLISGVIDYLKCGRVSIVGGSKGGSMALYYGIKHNLNNIITAVPQFNIGSYVAHGSYWEHVGKQMMGTITETNIAHLNAKLPYMVEQTKQKNSHIYLFTSPVDEQYLSEIVPHLPLFSHYEHFNLIESKSRLLTQHNQVMGFNLKLILALIYQFENGISPAWGHVRNGNGWDNKEAGV